MKTTSRPVQTTVVFGLICGLLLIPAYIGLSCVLSRPNAMCTTLWGFLCAYGLMLTTWSKKDRRSIVYPLLLALAAALWVDTIPVFLLIALGVFVWIRSGICYPENFIKRFLAEVALCFGGAVLATVLMPGTIWAWALAVWLFFLIQALYFIIFDKNQGRREKILHDPFDDARRQAENILSSGL
jgi:hypothetical protein